MKKTIITLFLVVAIAGSTVLASYEFQKKQEYEIYSIVLNELLHEHQAKLVVLWGQTSVGSHRIFDFDEARKDYVLNNAQAGPQGKADEINDITDAVWKNFKDRNSRTTRIEGRKIRLTVPLALYNNSDAPLSRKNPWGDFYHRYPGSWGWTELSRVGFDRTAHQAVVYVGTTCGGLCGSYYVFLVTKSSGKWKVAGEYLLWVS